MTYVYRGYTQKNTTHHVHDQHKTDTQRAFTDPAIALSIF